ncbi:MAG: DEAD/DEAH box helicase, partial [Candidatus Hodarchaeota archaeon]
MVIQATIECFPFDSLKDAQGTALYYLTKKSYVLVQAPTGFGKTAVSLSVVLPEIQNGRQIIIATRTKSQIFDIFLKWIGRFNEKNRNLISCVPLISRKDLCIEPKKKDV